MRSGKEWIDVLHLQPHVEGGWYRRVHTAPATIDTPHGKRPNASAIHYLLTRDAPTGHLHRNRSCILHFLQSGGPVEYYLLSESGDCLRMTLGFDVGQTLFLEVPAGVWKASRLVDDAEHALVSEVVVPGWSVDDHEFMARDRLMREFPRRYQMLSSLLR